VGSLFFRKKRYLTYLLGSTVYTLLVFRQWDTADVDCRNVAHRPYLVQRLLVHQLAAVQQWRHIRHPPTQTLLVSDRLWKRQFNVLRYCTFATGLCCASVCLRRWMWHIYWVHSFSKSDKSRSIPAKRSAFSIKIWSAATHLRKSGLATPICAAWRRVFTIDIVNIHEVYGVYL